mmetsp:Transcript_41477/g.66689  ORF Transcript_41477/g.66689 Transcript_41477/m.66689 type:complete len:137 (-) Transcript_41477:119-529(-)
MKKNNNKKKKRKKKQQKEGWMHTILIPDGKTRGLDSPEWYYDNSFWNDNQQHAAANYTFDEEKFKATILEVLGNEHSASLVSIEHFDSYRDVKTGRGALGYRFKYHNPYYPLGKEASLKLNEKVRTIISDNFGELR